MDEFGIPGHQAQAGTAAGRARQDFSRKELIREGKPASNTQVLHRQPLSHLPVPGRRETEARAQGV